MCTPETIEVQGGHKMVPEQIRAKILEKRSLRRVWHNSRHPEDRRAFNRAIRELKEIIDQATNETAAAQIESLTATSATNYSLWRACKNGNQPVVNLQ